MAAADESDEGAQPTWSVGWEDTPEETRFTVDGLPAVSPLLTQADVDLLLRGLRQLPDSDEVQRMREWLQRLGQDLRERR